MTSTPVPSLVFMIAFGAFTSAFVYGSVTPVTLPQCTGVTDVFTGCDGFLSELLHIGVLGTIPGAPFEINAIFGIVGLSARAHIIWALADWVRGR